MNSPARMVPLDTILASLSREELEQKRRGAYAHAEGLRDAIVRILRIADVGEPPIDPTGETP